MGVAGVPDSIRRRERSWLLTRSLRLQGPFIVTVGLSWVLLATTPPPAPPTLEEIRARHGADKNQEAT